MRKKAAALVLAACLLFALAACGTDAPAPAEDTPALGHATPEEPSGADEKPETEPLSPVDGMTVALLPSGTDGSDAAVKTAQRYAAQWGLNLLVLTDTNRQAAVRRARGEHVSGLCVAAADDALAAALQESVSAGIPVAVCDSEPLGGLRALRVSRGTAEQLGGELVEMAVTSLEERGVSASEEKVKYIWLRTEGAEETAWAAAGRSRIQERFPNWTEIDAPRSAGTGEEEALSAAFGLLDEYPSADLILCAGETALTAMCSALRERERNAGDVTVTGFCRPSSACACLQDGVFARCGYWDDGMEYALGCYLAAWVAAGNVVHVGDVVNVPRIGAMELLANDALSPEQRTEAVNDGVVSLPERIELTAKNATACIQRRDFLISGATALAAAGALAAWKLMGSETAEHAVEQRAPEHAAEPQHAPEDADKTVAFPLKNKFVDYSRGQDDPVYLFELETPSGVKEFTVSFAHYETYYIGDEVICAETDHGLQVL